MAEKTELPDPGSTKGTKDSGVRKLHYIVHLDAETDQIIKIEEMDEATNTTREMPLPLFLADPEEKSRAAEGGATGFVFDLPQQNPFSQPVTYPNYGYPMPWPMIPPQFMPPTPCVAPPCVAPPVGFAAPQTLPSMANAHVVLSTPKVDPPDPPDSAPVAHLVYSTPKVDPPDERSSMPGAHLVLSTPKVDPPDPPNSRPVAHLVFQTPKADTPGTPKEKSEGSGVRGGKVVGPCLKFRFKSE
ncbi:MAG TPA: hypothetical protein VJS17_10460 [Pyrinomonadaceae bacterium]|nr:hypothetical protein [Pyrinomonadaceae bacterium]